MSDEKKYFCFCSSNCKYETMTKEQILTAIAQALSTGKVENVDTGFITKVKEANGGRYVTFWVGTQAEYNALKEKKTDCLYIVTDSAANQAMDMIAQEVKEMKDALDNMADNIIDIYEDVESRNVVRYYASGIAEGTLRAIWTGLSFTTEHKGFYALDLGRQRVALDGIMNVVPDFCSINVSKATMTTENGEETFAPPIFAMVCGTPEKLDGYGVVSQRILLLADERAENVTIEMELHCRWKWNNKE